MESKQIWMTVLIALVVAIISSILTLATVGKTFLSPAFVTPDSPAFINAHECKADGVCEIKSADIRGMLNVSETIGIGNLGADPEYELFIYKPSSKGEIMLESSMSTIGVYGQENTLVLAGNRFGPALSSEISVQGDNKAILQFAKDSGGPGWWQTGMDTEADFKIIDAQTQSPRLIVHKEGIVEIRGGMGTDYINIGQQKFYVDDNEAGISVPLKFNKLGGTQNAYACISTQGYLYRSLIPCPQT